MKTRLTELCCPRRGSGTEPLAIVWSHYLLPWDRTGDGKVFWIDELNCERLAIRVASKLRITGVAWLPSSPLAALAGQRSRSTLRHSGRRANARPADVPNRETHSLAQRAKTKRFDAVIARRTRLRSIFGPFLAIIYTGHKFDSGLGITLTAVALLVVVLHRFLNKFPRIETLGGFKQTIYN